MKSLNVMLSNNIAYFLNLAMTASGSRKSSFRKKRVMLLDDPPFFMPLHFLQHQFSQHPENFKLFCRHCLQTLHYTIRSDNQLYLFFKKRALSIMVADIGN